MDVLLHLLGDQHPLVRVATAQSLLDFSPDKAYQALQLASQDEDRKVRRTAQDALKKVTKQRLPSDTRSCDSRIYAKDFSTT
jgi:HEAT repeat protein